MGPQAADGRGHEPPGVRRPQHHGPDPGPGHPLVRGGRGEGPYRAARDPVQGHQGRLGNPRRRRHQERGGPLRAPQEDVEGPGRGGARRHRHGRRQRGGRHLRDRVAGPDPEGEGPARTPARGLARGTDLPVAVGTGGGVRGALALRVRPLDRPAQRAVARPEQPVRHRPRLDGVGDQPLPGHPERPAEAGEGRPHDRPARRPHPGPATDARTEQGVDASAFRDLPAAQKHVQAALNDSDNIRTIEQWMEKQKQRVANGTFKPGSSPTLDEFTVTDANGKPVVTGSSVSKSDFASHGFSAQPTQVHSVKLVLAYSPDSGTFYVRTAFPSPP
ncbi:RNase A-like domain-containing protein [Streptomyces sp. NPDC008121]|uniref:RNase A-like domain-containing protein n=1 Tax=Streptomyces sp. NPDC008121 TaxID=3364809 RepID=UPI0036EEE275